MLQIVPNLLVACGLALSPALRIARPSSLATAQSESAARSTPSERVEVAEVIDGDTIHVLREGKLEKLRLLSVDTEEKLAPGMTSSPTKPQTVFGAETALWARGLFASLAEEDGRTRVGLVFPGGREQRDAFGRLLCHVLLPDGADFNLELVREGKSPYFDKYGRDQICHGEFVVAQAEAREKALGIWDPRTNEAREPGAPSAKRPYDRLIPWWNARALAVEDFRKRSAETPLSVIAAEEPDALERALASETGAVEVFGELERFFDEADGSLTVLFRSIDREHALRVRIARERREAHAALELPLLVEEFRQNYVYVRGRLARNSRGFELASESPEQWRRAGPEPAAVEVLERE